MCADIFFPLMFVKVPAVPAVISFAASLCRVREGIVEEMQMECSIWFFGGVSHFSSSGELLICLFFPPPITPTLINIYVLGHIKVWQR